VFDVVHIVIIIFEGDGTEAREDNGMAKYEVEC